MCNNRENLSYSEVIMKVQELPDFLKSFFLEDYLDNPSKKMIDIIRLSVSRALKLIADHKWLCGYNGCNKDSINSHVISEGKIRNALVEGGDNSVEVIDINLRTAQSNHFKPVSTRSACSFPGYCKEHDSELFEDLDKSTILHDDILLNQQFMRMVRYKIHQKEKNKLVLNDLLSEIERQNNETPDEVMCMLIERLKELIEIENSDFLELTKHYYQILKGIQENRTIFKTKIIKVDKANFMFQGVYLNKTDLLCILKEEYDGDSAYLYIGTSDNSSIDYSDNDLLGETFKLMLSIKSNFVFSQKFRREVAERIENILLKNNQLISYCPLKR